MTEPTIYQYRLRTPAGAWLADVVMRSDGYFSTVSDWGNYAYRWPRPGGEFRAFVARLGADYVCSTLGKRDWWDGTQTLRNIREHILEWRKDGSYTKAEAAEAYDSLARALGCWDRKEARDYNEIAIDQFSVWCHDTDVEMPYELGHYDYPPEVRGFCREVMPALASAIREQLAAEETATADREVPHG
ncbi:hypothetical protein [Comamonas sp. JC664]|uniref:hypothetical protein n=1 Tax=Comamonas sp. JC664 TaxID=2801917 RepID=UPI00174D2262|nr:hypothetical protein [Comamonas sp. JC664]MBL0698967.1 hypothetical protein [Comamonas sp. JC664]GHG79835.1 hypothetical protein GCM10012319_32090 [Comamonas sp. KCTC 72670]